MKQTTFLIFTLLTASSITTTTAVLAKSNERSWTELDDIIDDAIKQGAFPGAIQLIATKDKILFESSRGTFTYGEPAPASGTNPAVTSDTLWDLASISKVFGSTTAAALLYQNGHLDLDAKVSDILPEYAQNGKGSTTIRNLFLHNAGLPCDPIPGYYQAKFGCPEAQKSDPKVSFSCRAKCFQQMMEQELINPIGSKYVYCDMCLMIAAHVIGKLAFKYGYVTSDDVIAGCPLDEDGWEQCYYDAFVRRYIFDALKLKNTMFNPPEEIWYRVAPTENDTWYRHRIVQGQIHDENTYAMGGIAGHAGIFSTAGDLLTFTRKWLFAEKDEVNFVNSTTSKYFTRIYNKSQSSRAIGWNTNDPEARGYGDGGMCGSLSPTTYLHTGFTGTMVCADPERELVVILLTNRIYKTRLNDLQDVIRPVWSTAVQEIFDYLKAENKL